MALVASAINVLRLSSVWLCVCASGLAVAEFSAKATVGKVSSAPKRQANMVLYDKDIFPPL
jgi:hypothetical protein